MTTPWISVAKSWLVANTPCDKLTALQQIAAKMPLSVRRRGRSIGDRNLLAVEAISRCYKKRFIDLPDTLQQLSPQRKASLGYSATIRDLASRAEGVSKAELRFIKHGHTLARQLAKKGELFFDSQVYRSVTTTQERQ